MPMFIVMNGDVNQHATLCLLDVFSIDLGNNRAQINKIYQSLDKLQILASKIFTYNNFI